MGAGEPFPLGANVEGDGVALRYFQLTRQRSVMFVDDDNGEQEIARIALTEQTQQIWHVFVQGLKAEQLYGYRVYGSYEPQAATDLTPINYCSTPMRRQLVGEYSDHGLTMVTS